MRIDVLGPVRALRGDGTPIALGGPRHREVLARLVAAEGRMVATDTLVADLWPEPPARGPGALRAPSSPPCAARRRARPAAAHPAADPGHGGFRLRIAAAARGRGRAPVPGRPGTRPAAPPARSPRSARSSPPGADRPTPTCPTPPGRSGSAPGWRSCGCRGSSSGPAFSSTRGRAADSSPNSAHTPTSTPGARRPGRCWHAPCTGTDARPTRWPRSAGPARCSSNNWGSTPEPNCGGGWRRRSSTDPRPSNRPSTSAPGPLPGSAPPVPPWNWPAPWPWRAATRSSSRGATGSPPPPGPPSARGTPN